PLLPHPTIGATLFPYTTLFRSLGVQYVLEGSVRKADGQVRITAQLIDALQDHHLWTERYDRPLKDIFALQDEIVRKIVTTLKLQDRKSTRLNSSHVSISYAVFC